MTEAAYPSYIYGLVDPRSGVVRYIGKTQRQIRNAVESRYNRHIAESKSTPLLTHKTRWISGLLELGLKPEVLILDEIFCSTEELSSLERLRIAEYRALDVDLTNTTDGGDGGRGRGPLSPASKESQRLKLRAANLGAKRSVEARQKMREATLRIDPEVRRARAKAASDAAKLAGISEDGRRRISESSRRPKSPETRARMREAALLREARKRGEKDVRDE